MQSTSPSIHVAIIMDGNGRWALRRGLPRSAGHHAGVDAIRRVVEAAPEAGIGTLSLFAFSSDNWARPAEEVQILMALFARFLRDEAGPLRAHDVRLSVIGRRDRLPPELVSAIAAAEALTAPGTRLHLRVAVDYSSRNAILEAARLGGLDDPTREAFAIRLGDTHGGPAPDVDLLIRTGGEQRLSDFLLWESAYAELFFTARMWPDFREDDLAAAVAEFRGRDRRFGALSESGRR
ncbi:MAG TPA: di-trans,poly-cis-decaprenylcistransferase [Candidatus Dormibacteraeota bacterium]|jgi:undecaprenyl diphosphate synthase|nr:di-trans,poly-cis-decaprenylcistransferase [Candidatus Dormibacteraeota bacterium]